MREIKFRAWNHTTQTMETVEELTYNHGVIDQINTDQDRILFPDKEAELMQYTGLKDKNGVEIYEGDIIRNTLDTDHDVYQVPEISFYVFGKAAHFMIWPEEYEVIGNVWENPELLK
jgi:uncharacterized phage protein (TIGR01671 family)